MSKTTTTTLVCDRPGCEATEEVPEQGPQFMRWGKILMNSFHAIPEASFNGRSNIGDHPVMASKLHESGADICPACYCAMMRCWANVPP